MNTCVLPRHNHVRTHANYPDSGLGGHSACRNPDGEARAYCFTQDKDVRWDYCDVGPPATACEHTRATPPPPNISVIGLNLMYQSTAKESQYKFFTVALP